jgi:transporter family-2 protein
LNSGLAITVLVLVGAQLALQAPINNGLGRHTGRMAAAAVSFGVGSLILGVAVLLSGDVAGLSGIQDASPYMLLGGFLGAAFVLTATLVVRIIGAGAVAAATITGQLVTSMFIDRAGVLGLPENPITVGRLLGGAALLGGTFLVVRGRQDETGPEASRSGPKVAASGRWLPFAATAAMVLASSAVAVQAPINAQLSDLTGDLNASFASFVVGAVVLLTAVVITGRTDGLRGVSKARPWQLSGGLMGVINTTAALALVQTVGAGAITAAIVAGQLGASVAIDRFGAFGLTRTSLSAARIWGLLLLAGGVVLIAV